MGGWAQWLMLSYSTESPSQALCKSVCRSLFCSDDEDDNDASDDTKTRQTYHPPLTLWDFWNTYYVPGILLDSEDNTNRNQT